MFFKNSFSIVFIIYFLNIYLIKGKNLTTTNVTPTVTVTTTTTNISSTISCLEGDNDCLLIKNQAESTRGGARRLFLLFVGCLFTTFLIIVMIMTYHYVIDKRRHSSSTTNTNLNDRFHHLLERIGLNNLNKRGRFSFFSISNNNHSSESHRQEETSRTHLSENQDEALLFDDPYADGGITGGLQGSAINPYKSLTLSVT